MTGAFDPYYRWLGIPSQDQPPNHYRLLGVPLFENSPDVIEHAADQRMAHLRTFQAGEHSAESQRLLNEVSAARVCLADPARKAAYDAMLQRLTIRPPSPAPPVQRKRSPASAEHAVTPRSEGVSDRRIVRWRIASTWVALGLAVAVVSLCALIFLWPQNSSRALDGTALPRAPAAEIGSRPTSGSPSDTAQTPTPVQPSQPLPTDTDEKDTPNARRQEPSAAAAASTAAAGAVAQAEAPAADDIRGNVPVAGNEAAQTPTAEPPKTPTTAPQAPIAHSPGQSTGASDAPSASKPQDQTTTTEAVVPAPEKPKRRPVPADDTQAKILQQLDKVHKLAELRTPAEKLKVAKELLLNGQKMDGNADERFVYLRKAAELGCEARDGQLMLAAVDSLATEFEVDALGIKDKLLARLARNADDAASIQSFVDASRQVIDEALQADRLDVAGNVAELAYRACQRPAGQKLRKDFLPYRIKVQKARSRWDQVQEAKAILQKEPDNAQANLTVGLWNLVIKNDAKQAAWFLAKGSDPDLKPLAARELTNPPTKPADQVDLGDAWWNLGQARKGDEKDAMQAHAGEWYRRALTDLEPGANRTRIEKRLDLIAAVKGTTNAAVLPASTGTQTAATPAAGDLGRTAGKVIPEKIDTEVRLARKGGPYKVMGQVIVEPTGKLLLERGTTVLLAPSAVIVARGALNSYGDSEEFVRFRPAMPNAPFDKIRLEKGSDHVVERFDIRGGNRGIFADECRAEIKDCLLLGNRVGAETRRYDQGIYWFRNCMIANNLTDGVSLYLNHVGLDHCTVADNGGVGLNMTYYGRLTITACSITGNKVGIQSHLYDTNLNMKSSNIMGNRLAAIDLQTKDDFQCPGNYWGTDNPQHILMTLRDGHVKPGLGIVRFEPFENRAIRDAGCSLKIPREK